MTPKTEATIVYTRVDEAPALASFSLLPVVRSFGSAAGVRFEVRDISLSGRILAQFPDRLRDDQRISDDLAHLGEWAKTPDANIVKLPNISASVPQLEAAIRELQGQGYDVPDYPYDPRTDEERDVRARYDRVKGSAVNPVLREGNSDRRAPASVKAFARKHPHTNRPFAEGSKAHVATMSDGDLRHSEISVTVDAADAGPARIEHVAVDGATTVLRDEVPLNAGMVADAATMSRRALRTFLREQKEDAAALGVLFSVHLKATMMKVSDPILFGHAVSVFFDDVFTKHRETFDELGVNPNDGLGTLYAKLETLSEARRNEIEGDLRAVLDAGPDLAMVNSAKGISNLHVPSDVIIDASMPVAIRDGGTMWGPDDRQHEAKFVIPDSSYAGVYQAVIDDCKEHGPLDPTTIGSVPNVGLMAKKAEEYGSHDTTFEVDAPGTVRVVAASGRTLLERPVEAGDLFRLCRTEDEAIRDWVGLAVRRGRSSDTPVVFWLDADRPHDAQLIDKVRVYLKEYDTAGIEVHVLSPVDATKHACERLREGLDTISVTGNVLRDYLTDLFPILEVGTSAKMLSIVPLMNGGGLFETGAGGSAPKHVQQFVEEGHLRWDSLGEFLALVPSLEQFADRYDEPRARTLADALDRATARYLNENKGPSRKVREIDNRGSHFWLARYWAEELATQSDDADLAARFRTLAERLSDDADAIERELITAQGAPVDLGGYFRPDPAKAEAAMRPSATLNAALDAFEN